MMVILVISVVGVGVRRLRGAVVVSVGTQTSQNPLIKEYTLNYNRIP